MIRKILALLLLTMFLSVNPCYPQDITVGSDKVHLVPGKYQVRIAYTGSNPIYIGYADRGAATTDTTWFILKLSWTGTTVTLIQSGVGAWDSRADALFIYG